MPDRFIYSHIASHSMFSRLSPEQLNLVVKAFQVLRFQSGQLVIQQGNPKQGMFIFVSGEGYLGRADANGTLQPVANLVENQIIDDDALFGEGPEPYTLYITADAVLLFLSRKRMMTVLSYYPEIRQSLGQLSGGSQPPPERKISPQAREAVGTELGIQRDNEEILFAQRRHPWSYIRRMWISVLIFVISGVAAYLTSAVVLLSVTLLGLGVLLAGLLALYFYFEWRNDSIVITDQRVIKIERVIPTFSVNINEIPIDSVHEVNTELPDLDLFARIFNYGSVELKNAADAGDMVLDMVSNPDEIQDLIFNYRNVRIQENESMKREALRADVERQLGINSRPVAQTSPLQGAPASPSKQRNAWASLSPVKMRFTDKDGNTVFRKHVTIWISAIIVPALVIFGGFVVMFFSMLSVAPDWLGRVGIPLGILISIFGALWLAWSDWDWRNDMYILSDSTITLIHRRPLWLQNEDERIILNRVDNVRSETNGPLNALLSRGNVRISLVGEGLDNAKIFPNVHRPHEIQAEISRRQARAKASMVDNETIRQREAISEYLSVYHETVSDAQQATSQNLPQSPNVMSQPRPTVNTPNTPRPPRVPRVRPDDNRT